MRKIADAMDLIYFSSRKLGFSRGGAIVSNNNDLIMKMKEYILLVRFECQALRKMAKPI